MQRFRQAHVLFSGWLLATLLLAGCNSSSEPTAGHAPKAGHAQSVPPVSQSADANAPAQPLPEVVMYKSPTCECCTGWAEHLRRNGFSVVEHKRDDMSAIKTRFGISEPLASCHTASVDGYIIEGHVPAADVERLLRERPKIAGLSAPGMPMKSPGMQAADQPPQGYSVLAFDKAGNTTVYHQY